MPVAMKQKEVNEYLTGRRQYREYYSRFGDRFLILQVEKSIFTPSSDKNVGSWKCYWFDAAPEDVLKEELAT